MYGDYQSYNWRVNLWRDDLRMMTMIRQQLRKAGNSYVVTIPKEEVERHGWQVGQEFAVQLTPLETRPTLRPELREALAESWERNESGYRYLAER